MLRFSIVVLVLALCFALASTGDIAIKDYFTFNNENTAATGIIAKDANNLYVATSTGIVRFNIANRGRTGALKISNAETIPTTLVIDSSNTYGYFTTTYTSGVPSVTVTRLVQFHVANLTRVNYIDLYDHETTPSTAHFDASGANLYIGLRTTQAQVVQIKVPSLVRGSGITLQNTEKNIRSSVVDVNNNVAYYSTDKVNFVSVNLNNFQRTTENTISSVPNTENFNAAAYDTTAAYFGSLTGVVYKFTFGANGKLVFQVNTTLAANDPITGIIVDNNNVYVLQNRAPARVTKLDKNLASPTSLDLEAGTETNGVQMIQQGSKLWVTCQPGATPLVMVEVDAASLTRVSTGLISENINNIRLTTLDANNNFIVVNSATPSTVFQLRPDGTLIGKFTLDTTDKAEAIYFANNRVFVAATDNTFAYIYTLAATAKLANLTLTKVTVSASVLPIGAIFADNTHVYVAGGNGGLVARYPQLSIDSNAVTLLELLTGFKESRFISASVDQSTGHVYMVTHDGSNNPNLMKIRLVDFVRVSIPRSLIDVNDKDVKSIAVAPNGNAVFVVSKIATLVSPFSYTRVIRISTTDFTRTSNSFGSSAYLDPLAIAVDTNSEYVYVTTGSGSVFILDAPTLGSNDGTSMNYIPAATAVYTRPKFMSTYYSFVASANTPSTLYTQTYCPPGFVINGETCNKCLKGTYASAGVCVPCPAGTYCENDGMTTYTNCPPGTASNLVRQTSNSTCVACTPGFYATGPGATECLVCPVGGYCPTTQTVSPTPCPAGTFSNNTQQTSNSTCTQCPAGSYQNSQGSNTCIYCNPGTYSQVVAADSAVACKPCYPGSTSDRGALWCRLCDPGTEGGSNPGLCTPCVRGKFSNSYGATSCSNCPAGTYQDSTGKTQCIKCGPGTYKANPGQITVCDECQNGEYQPLSGQTSCLKCPAGSYNNQTRQTACNSCPPGFSSGQLDGADGVEYCAACPAGKFAPTMGTPKCIDCPVGSYSDTFNSTSCTMCAPGYYQAQTGQTGCLPCPIGQYSNRFGSTACTACKVGTVSSGVGKTSCDPCGPGFVARANQAGVYFCDICPAGKYSDQTTAGAVCLDCPVGYYQPEAGKSSCIKCPPGTSSPLTSTQCIPCNVGTYSTDVTDTCQQCPSHTYAPNTGSTSCIKCPPGYQATAAGSYQCTACPKGSYNDRVGSACRTCPAGTYNADVGQTSCKTCPPGSYAAAGSSFCTLCAPGTFQPNSGSTACTPCQQGSFAPSAGSTSCDLCPAGFTAATAGATDCTACALGTFADKPGSPACRNCPSGSWTAADRSTSCFKCKPGFYLLTTQGNFKVCAPCDLGTFNPNEGSASCSDCPAGSYQDEYGQAVCKKCPAGTASVNTKQTGVATCTPCGAGKFADEGSTTCRDCPLGAIPDPVSGGSKCAWCPAGTVYHVNSNNPACIPCPAGTFQPQEGVHNQEYTTQFGGANSPIGFLTVPWKTDSFVQSCIPCPIGTHAPMAGSASCSLCPLSTYAATNGTASCAPCPGNTYTTKLGASNYTDCTSACNQGFVPRSQSSGSPCVACEPGTFWDIRTGGCTSCPAGSYQNQAAQTECKPCQTAETAGAKTCKICTTLPSMENGTSVNKTVCVNSGYKFSASIVMGLLAAALVIMTAMF